MVSHMLPFRRVTSWDAWLIGLPIVRTVEMAVEVDSSTTATIGVRERLEIQDLDEGDRNNITNLDLIT